MAFDNIPIYNALASGNVDAVETEGFTLDQCMTHSSPDGTLHYHSLGKCATPGGIQSTQYIPGICKNNYDTCQRDPFAHALTSFPWTNNYGGDFGLAKDGHVIKGPYNAQGELWDCT